LVGVRRYPDLGTEGASDGMLSPATSASSRSVTGSVACALIIASPPDGFDAPRRISRDPGRRTLSPPRRREVSSACSRSRRSLHRLIARWNRQVVTRQRCAGDDVDGISFGAPAHVDEVGDRSGSTYNAVVQPSRRGRLAGVDLSSRDHESAPAGAT
jgi:hypothetical protein